MSGTARKGNNLNENRKGTKRAQKKNGKVLVEKAESQWSVGDSNYGILGDDSILLRN